MRGSTAHERSSKRFENQGTFSERAFTSSIFSLTTSKLQISMMRVMEIEKKKKKIKKKMF